MDPYLFIFIFFLLLFIEKHINIFLRNRFIRRYVFSESLFDKISETYPDLTQQDLELVTQGLRQFFIVCNKANNKMVAMPSRIVDVAWHEFILHSRDYHFFCRHGYGRHLHHSPFLKTNAPEIISDSLKRAWYYACEIENIDSRKPSRIPLLFCIDTQLNIADGNRFSLEIVNQVNQNKYDSVLNVDQLFDCASDAGGCGSCGGCGGG